MMCGCDREFSETYLAHQLASGTDIHSGLDVMVTIGFQDGICRECRGLSPEACPKGELYGRSSKIKRYYWREIFFETTKRYAKWAAETGIDLSKECLEHLEKHAEIEREVIDELKVSHKIAPKYNYDEPPAAEYLSRYNVEVVNLRAKYVRDDSGKRMIINALGAFKTPETLAAAHFQSQGFDSMQCESRPFHVLFGIYMWLVIQDPRDELGRPVCFGSRTAFEAGESVDQIMTILPMDFGKPGYAERQANALEEHFTTHLQNDLLWLFDYWLEPSAGLRQYLWAHRQEDVKRARMILEVLSPAEVKRLLRYLVDSYWERYVGWPDLLVHRTGSFFFAEVKGSGDKLSLNQKRWIADNSKLLGFPFKLVKIHREHQLK